jgi:Tfp pilus assembly protein PilO
VDASNWIAVVAIVVPVLVATIVGGWAMHRTVVGAKDKRIDALETDLRESRKAYEAQQATLNHALLQNNRLQITAELSEKFYGGLRQVTDAGEHP